MGFDLRGSAPLEAQPLFGIFGEKLGYYKKQSHKLQEVTEKHINHRRRELKRKKKQVIRLKSKLHLNNTRSCLRWDDEIQSRRVGLSNRSMDLNVYQIYQGGFIRQQNTIRWFIMLLDGILWKVITLANHFILRLGELHVKSSSRNVSFHIYAGSRRNALSQVQLFYRTTWSLTK